MQCRICFEEGGNLVSPCNCSGTSAYIHSHCLDQYVYHYPDRICRVCHTEFRTPRQMLPFFLTIFCLACMLFASRETLNVKVALYFLLATVIAFYRTFDLFNQTTGLVIIGLWTLFLIIQHFQAKLFILGSIIGISLIYSFSRFVPVEIIFNIFGVLLVYAYIGFITLLLFTNMDPMAFAVYITITYMFWNGIVRGHNPLRLLGN